MNQVRIDATADELQLLEALWAMASASHELVDTGVLPGRALVSTWSDIFRAWRGDAPTLEALQVLRNTLGQLARRRIIIESAMSDYEPDAVIDVKLLSDDSAGTDNVRVLVNVSGYAPLILKAQPAR